MKLREVLEAIIDDCGDKAVGYLGDNKDIDINKYLSQIAEILPRESEGIADGGVYCSGHTDGYNYALKDVKEALGL